MDVDLHDPTDISETIYVSILQSTNDLQKTNLPSYFMSLYNLPEWGKSETGDEFVKSQ